MMLDDTQNCTRLAQVSGWPAPCESAPVRRCDMRQRSLVWIVGMCVAAAGATSLAQSGAPDPAVMRAVDRINAAFQARDTKAYDALTTADFVRVASNGRMFSKADWMKTVAAPGATRGAGKYEEVSVRVYGNGAVVTYRNIPEPGAVSYLTRIMERQGTEWKLALALSTDVKPPAPPAGPEPPALPAWSPSSPDEKGALAAFQAIQKANRDNDLAAWERLSAPDHVIITVTGTKTSRAERVAALKKAATGVPATPAGDQNVRLIVKGDVAAVTWTQGQSRSLKVLARQGGEWRQVLQQSAPIVTPK